MTGSSFNFRAGNFSKLLAIPKYLLAGALTACIPRSRARWTFGSGVGVGEGALPLAQELRKQDPRAHISWVVSSEREKYRAIAEGFFAVRRTSWAGFWATARARHIVVTHGLGDVNRYGTMRAKVTHLGHGVPLKLLHLDSPVTTETNAPRPLRAILNRMYRVGSRSISLYVAGSQEAADRLRSAYRVEPGQVRVLGDPRDDVITQQKADPQELTEVRSRLLTILEISADSADTLILYAPTWRDGDPDPAIPTPEEAASIHRHLEEIGAQLVIRSHPLGAGEYFGALGPRVRMLSSDQVTEITPMLGAFDMLITDYSSIAVDYALLKRPIIWFAPDLEGYSSTRGLYEPLEKTASTGVMATWGDVFARIVHLSEENERADEARRQAREAAAALSARFHKYPDGGAARRVLDYIRQPSSHSSRPRRSADAALPSVFFESFYGRQASCNPYALDREIARQFPHIQRVWSVTSENVQVPAGATQVLVGSAEWHHARRNAKLLIVNDWLRHGFRRRRKQTVLQTWHGTMLKHLALGRPRVSLRTQIAIRRESRRWNLLLSQNPHSSREFRRSYAFHGEIIETGYPRDDRLAQAVRGEARTTEAVSEARRVLGITETVRHVLAYVPTWREQGGTVDAINVQQLALELGPEWVVVARGHTRSSARYSAHKTDAADRVIDASRHPDINDIILAADLVVTDYSSIMFDAAVANVPLAFFVPDIADYRDRERGFTFDFEACAPGPLARSRSEITAYAKEVANDPIAIKNDAYEAWKERFVPYDDGFAAARVVDELVKHGVFATNTSK